MEDFWVPCVNRHASYGHREFAEFTDVYENESDFGAKIEAEFDKMINAHVFHGD